MMAVSRTALIVIVLALLLGCSSTEPLPEGEPPNDFLFIFTHQRLTDFDKTVEVDTAGKVVREGEAAGPEDGAENAPEVSEAPAPEGVAAGEESPGPETPVETAPLPEETAPGAESSGTEEGTPGSGTAGGDGDEPADPAEDSVMLPVPSFVKVTVDLVGRTDIEVTHTLPRENTSKQTITIEREELMELYELIRAANLYNLPEEFEDGDWQKGKETYSVIGRNKPVTVTVTGTEVPELTKIKLLLLDLLPVKDLLTLPAVIDRKVVMDRRTGIFYRADEEAVKNIPLEYQKEYKDPWRALNDGGFPSSTFGPLPKEWD
jgi:hypothetical protein